MTISSRSLHEPMLTRDEAEIRSVVASIAREEGAEALFRAVSRFALLAYNPSQHAKHALLAVTAAWEVREDLGGDFAAVLAECAVYAANARLPWSEAPLLDPPRHEGQSVSLDEAREAIRARDALRLQSWLAARIRSGELREAFFELAADDLRDFGHPFVIATAAWKLSLLQDAHPSYPVLRVAAVEWCAAREDEPPQENEPLPDETLARVLAARVVARQGAVDAFHDLVLFDAACEAAALGAPAPVVHRVKAAIPRESAGGSPPDTRREMSAPVYPLARDYAELLLAHAIASRLRDRGWVADPGPLVAAAEYNLRSSSFDEWSFA
ncbi:MAG: hypothetical protein ACRD2J_16455 [Thermoanaerobaculia bacterium]